MEVARRPFLALSFSAHHIPAQSFPPMSKDPTLKPTKSAFRLMDAITIAHDGNIQMIDSTSVRVHQQAATAKRGVQITVAVAPGAGSRPKSTSSTRRGSRSGSAFLLEAEALPPRRYSLRQARRQLHRHDPTRLDAAVAPGGNFRTEPRSKRNREG